MSPSRQVTASDLVLGRMREDPALEARVIAEVARRRTRPLRVGLVAAAGDTALSLLALEAVGAIEAVDESATQVQLVELKRGAIAKLPLVDQLALLGAAPSTPETRLALYARLAPSLPEETRRYWDQASEAVAFGLARAGSEDRRWASLATALRVHSTRRLTLQIARVECPGARRRRSRPSGSPATDAVGYGRTAVGS